MAGTHDIARAAGLKDTEVHTVFATILEKVKNGERVLIKDFGTFQVKQVKERTITSPQIPSGSAVVPEHQVMKFKASPVTKDLLNGVERPEKPKKEAPAAKPAPNGKNGATAKPAAKPAAPAAKPAAKPTGTKKPATKPAQADDDNSGE